MKKLLADLPANTGEKNLARFQPVKKFFKDNMADGMIPFAKETRLKK